MASRQRRGAGGTSSGSGRVLKWVGAATAVISLILGARQLITIATDRAQRSRESAEFTALARQQAGRGEFAEAWQSLDRAEERSRTEATAAARLDVGFRWLEEGRPGSDQPFSRITDAVVPALDRALLDPQHPRRADILAHLGWATFLKGRETGTGDPAPLYKQALAIDPHNVYANVMLGHWLVWQGEPLDAARPYFDAAVANGQERPLVRNFQLAALRNRNDASADTELIRVVNSMRRQSETLDERTARTAYVAYVSRYGPRARTPDAGDIGIPASDLLATFAWLTRMPGVSDRAEINDQVVATLKK
jgi:Tfp pilus assembly protein PilF